MSAERDLTRIVRSWLHEDAHEDADRVLDLVLDQLDTTPQRRAGWLARRLPTMNNNIIRFGVAAAAVVLAVILGVNFLSGPSVGGDQDPTPSPTPTAAVSPVELPSLEGVPLSAGTYSLGASFPVGITFEVPSGWSSCSQGVLEQGLCYGGHPGVALTFLIVDNVVADPCDSSRTLLDPPVGPSVEDLVAAISNLAGFEASATTDVTVDGFQGKQFTLTAPDIEGCGWTWATADRTAGVAATEVNEVRILDVDGVRLVITGTYFPQTPEESLSAYQQAIASVGIEP